MSTQIPYRVIEQFVCEIEPANFHSNNAIVANNVDKQMVGHVSDALIEKLLPLIRSWKIWKDSTIITGKERRAPEEPPFN